MTCMSYGPMACAAYSIGIYKLHATALIIRITPTVGLVVLSPLCDVQLYHSKGTGEVLYAKFYLIF